MPKAPLIIEDTWEPVRETKLTTQFPLIHAAADLILHEEYGMPSAVSGTVYHSSTSDGPCPSMEIGTFRIQIDPEVGAFEALHEIGSKAALDIALRAMRTPKQIAS